LLSNTWLFLLKKKKNQQKKKPASRAGKLKVLVTHLLHMTDAGLAVLLRDD